MLESKLSTGTSRTKRLHQDKFAFSLFWMSQCVACSPAWRILYHVTASCKGPISYFDVYRNVKNIQKLNERMLEMGVEDSQAWHKQYKDSAYIFIGNLFSSTICGSNHLHFHSSMAGMHCQLRYLCYSQSRPSVPVVNGLMNSFFEN